MWRWFGPMTLATTMQQSLGAFTVNLFVLFCFDYFSPHFLFFIFIFLFACFLLFKKYIMSFVYYQVHDIIDGDVSDRKGSYVEKEYHVITSPFAWTC
jgi:hypothetical protein